MAILRTIVQKSLLLGDKILHLRTSDLKESQYEEFTNLLRKARNTDFGQYHSFERLLNDHEKDVESLYKQFCHSVPPSNYNQIYEKWWSKAFNGEGDVCWPGKTKYFALSSGTSEVASKKIPVTHNMLRCMKLSSLRAIYPLLSGPYRDKLFEHDVLLIGGSARLKETGNGYMGDLSGIQAANLPLWFMDFYKPGRTISSMEDWNDRIEKIIEHAPGWNIGIIVGIPSWVKLIMEGIIRRYGLKSIHDIWPNLFLYIHSGVSLSPYRSALQRLCAKELIYMESYLASEGFIGYQTDPEKPGLSINLNAGIFYEFVEFNEKNFTSEGEIRPGSSSVMLHEIRTGIPYAVLLNTCAGAWRYLLGDILEFISPMEFKILGRTKQFLSICGEHLSVDNMNNAICDVSLALKTEIQEYTVIGVHHEGAYRHQWFVGVDDAVPLDLFTKMLDKALCEGNDDYKTERASGQLNLGVRFLPTKMFYEYLKYTGRLGAQNKVPRVQSGKNAEKWFEFIGHIESEHHSLQIIS